PSSARRRRPGRVCAAPSSRPPRRSAATSPSTGSISSSTTRRSARSCARTLSSPTTSAWTSSSRASSDQNHLMQNVVERVLNLLIYLLESPRPVAADDVRYTVQGYGQESDEAFHRMFERDKDLLRRMGVPLKLVALDEWEVDFGYTVDPDEYALADPGLTQEEKVALPLPGRMVGLGGAHLGGNARWNLGGVGRAAGLEPLGAGLREGSGVLGELLGAVGRRRGVAFDYRGHRREAEPRGIADRRGHW